MDGQDVKRLREQAGLSQEKLARLLGSRQPTVWRWENGKVRIPLPMQKLLALLAPTILEACAAEPNDEDMK